MQNMSVQLFCLRCRNALHFNEQFCGFCGLQQPRNNMAPKTKKGGISAWSITTLVIVGGIVGSCGLCGLFSVIMVAIEGKQPVAVANAAPTPVELLIPTSNKSVTTTPSPPAPKSIGSDEQRLQVAADVRNYLRNQDIPAAVVAYGNELSVTYKYAAAENSPYLAFVRQQGKEGLQKMANAGFDSVKIEAYDKGGQLRTTNISLNKYRTLR